MACPPGAVGRGGARGHLSSSRGPSLGRLSASLGRRWDEGFGGSFTKSSPSPGGGTACWQPLQTAEEPEAQSGSVAASVRRPLVYDVEHEIKTEVMVLGVPPPSHSPGLPQQRGSRRATPPQG